jgi:hypothetical protein
MDGGPAGRRRSVARGVSAYPVSVTGAMAANFTAGGAAINQICKTFDISLKVNQLALEKPTGDITREPALAEFGRHSRRLPRRCGRRRHHHPYAARRPRQKRSRYPHCKVLTTGV